VKLQREIERRHAVRRRQCLIAEAAQRVAEPAEIG